MEYLNIGKYVSTHGLKGEIKILSDFDNNNQILIPGNTIYIGKDKMPYKINTYRKHKNYDMITLETLDSIEKVLPYKGSNIFMNKDDINKDLFEGILNYDVYNNDIYIGKVIEILKGVKYDLIVVSERRIIIPFIDNFILSVDKDNKVIKTNYMI